MRLSSASRGDPRETPYQDNLRGVSSLMPWLCLGAGELFPLHLSGLSAPLCSITPPPHLLKMCKMSISREKRLEVVKTSSVTALISNTAPQVLCQLPGSCPPAHRPQAFPSSPSYKALGLQSFELIPSRRAPERHFSLLAPAITPRGFDFKSWLRRMLETWRLH